MIHQHDVRHDAVAQQRVHVVFERVALGLGNLLVQIRDVDLLRVRARERLVTPVRRRPPGRW